MTKETPNYFHVHLVSDSTGETLSAVAKAAAAQYSQIKAIEHLHSLVRNKRLLDRALQDIEQAPGIVLYTIVNAELAQALEVRCQELNVPCVPLLRLIVEVFESYLGTPSRPTVGGQHLLDSDYFRRIDALNFTMVHDDGKLPDDIDQADIVLVGISRTSKTPTSIYLANRGFKTANVPLVPGIPPPERLEQPTSALVVGLVASPERIAQIRRNRVLTMADRELDEYVDRDAIAAEINYSRKLCTKHRWPVIDVTRRSIEETAAAIVQLYHDRSSEVIET